jgi:hypothetical protein
MEDRMKITRKARALGLAFGMLALAVNQAWSQQIPRSASIATHITP